jgi:hypothetical protein
MYGVKRTTIFLDPELLRAAQTAARREGRSFAAVVREALVAYLNRPAAEGRLPSLAGKFASGTSDTSVRADDLLWKDPHA